MTELAATGPEPGDPATPGPSWGETARQHAERLLTLVELLLQRALARAEERDATVWERRLAAQSSAIDEAGVDATRRGLVLPDGRLVAVAGLQPLEVMCLWLAAAPQLDPTLRPLVARLNDNVLRDYVDPALCLRLLATSRQERLQLLALLRPDAPLFERELLRLHVRPEGGGNPLLHELVPASHVVAFLAGVRTPTRAAAPCVRRLLPAAELAERHRHEHPPGSARGLARELLLQACTRTFEGWTAPPASAAGGGTDPDDLDLPRGLGVLLAGPVGSGRTTLVKVVAAALGRPLLLADGRLLAQLPSEQGSAALAGLVAEAELYGELLLVREARELISTGGSLTPALARELRRRDAIVILLGAGDERLDPALEPLLPLRPAMAVPLEGAPLVSLWQAQLPAGVGLLDPGALASLAGRLRLLPGEASVAARLALLLAPPTETGLSAPATLDLATLERAARLQRVQSMGTLAAESRPDLRLADVILPPEVERQVQQIVHAARNRQRVLRDWGLGRRIRRGLGIICLFDGDPGTGKTLCAEAIAGELGLSLMRINIAATVDKYIGETEKNLGRIFEQAHPDHSLLLFDEADSLFSKRTEVSRSSDRYSNMDINVLLQLIERYEGLVLLTTNLRRSIDKAFERRFTFKVEFPLPGPRERERIWRLLLPDDVPSAEPLDLHRLAGVPVAGGEIKNAVISAAYAALQQGSLLRTEHLLEALRREVASSGRLLRGDGVGEEDEDEDEDDEADEGQAEPEDEDGDARQDEVD